MPDRKAPISETAAGEDDLDLDAQIDALLAEIDDSIAKFDEGRADVEGPSGSDDVAPGDDKIIADEGAFDAAATDAAVRALEADDASEAEDGSPVDDGVAVSDPEASPDDAPDDAPDDTADEGVDSASALSAGVDALLDGLDDMAFEPAERVAEEPEMPVEEPVEEPVEADIEAASESEAEPEVDIETRPEPDAAAIADRPVPASVANDPDSDLAVDELDHELASLIDDEMGDAPAPPRRDERAASERLPEARDPAIEPEPVAAVAAEAGRAAEPAGASTNGSEPKLPRIALPEGRPKVPQDADWRDWLRYAAAVVMWAAPIVWAFVARHAIMLARRGAPYAARGVELSAKPLDGRPAIVRSAVGWVAIYTAFLAFCVWSFVLIFRQPDKPVPSAEPVRLSETTEQS